MSLLIAAVIVTTLLQLNLILMVLNPLHTYAAAIPPCDSLTSLLHYLPRGNSSGLFSQGCRNKRGLTVAAGCVWIDHNRNIIYNRARDNCQTLTQEVCIVHWFVSLRLCFLTQLAIMTFFYLTHTCTSQPSLIFVTMEAYIHFLVAFTPIP